MKRLLTFSILLAACATKAPPAPPAESARAPAPPSKMADAPEPTPAPNAAPAAPSAPPVVAAEPPYDLAADRVERVALAKKELGARSVTATVSDVFVVIGPPGWQGAAFEQSVSLFKNAMAGYMNGRFSKKPDRAISVYLFPEGTSYERFCKTKYSAPCLAHFGFYQPSDRNMVMNAGLGLGTLTHEIVHPLVEADFPKAPTWINEGIASVFEAPSIPRPGEIHGVKNWRYPRLRRAMTSPAEKGHARLDTLFTMSDETFRGDDEDLNYALARYVCQWLDERGKLWAFFQTWRDTVDQDPWGTKAFEKVTGMTPAAASEPFGKWAMAL